MAKRSITLESLVIGVVSVLIGLISVAFNGSVFSFFFVAIVIAVLWTYTRRMNEMQKRLYALESRLPRETPPAPSPS